MKFYRIYIELTNACGLSCSFCPTKTLPSQKMDLPFFELVIMQVKSYTKEVACHVMGDPLTLPNLSDYLDIIGKYGLKAVLTTSGYFLKKQNYTTLFHPSVKQINISLNSFNKNDTALSFEAYMNPVLALCQEKLVKKKEIFINLRIWNFDEVMSEQRFNERLFSSLSRAFGVVLDPEKVYAQRPKSLRLASKILIHFDSYFEWPSLENRVYGDGTCQGLQSHIAILASGKVLPCCLDGEGIMVLGDLHDTPLEAVLSGSRAQSMIHGFREGRAVEELCRKCNYKERFSLS